MQVGNCLAYCEFKNNDNNALKGTYVTWCTQSIHHHFPLQVLNSRHFSKYWASHRCWYLFDNKKLLKGSPLICYEMLHISLKPSVILLLILRRSFSLSWNQHYDWNWLLIADSTVVTRTKNKLRLLNAFFSRRGKAQFSFQKFNTIWRIKVYIYIFNYWGSPIIIDSTSPYFGLLIIIYFHNDRPF